METNTFPADLPWLDGTKAAGAATPTAALDLSYLGHLHEGHCTLLHPSSAGAALHNHRQLVLPAVLEGTGYLLTLSASQRPTYEQSTEPK